MIGSIKIYWKLHRLSVAIVITIIIFGTTLLLPMLSKEPYTFLDALKLSASNIGLYLIMTPVFMIFYYLYKKQQQDKNPGYKANMPDVFNLDTFLKVYTIYATLAFIAGLFIEKVLYMQ